MSTKACTSSLSNIFIHISKNLETTQMSIKGCVNKLCYIYKQWTISQLLKVKTTET